MVETFGTLKTRISVDSKHTDSGYLAPIGDAIVSAIRRYEGLRIWLSQTRTTLTLTAGSDNVALPANFKNIHTLKLIDSSGRVYSGETGFEQLTLIDLEELQYISPKPTQRPEGWAVQGTTLYVNSLADAEYSIPLVYYRKDTDYPSADGDTSIWFADESVELIRYQAMAIFYRDHLHNSEKAAEYEIKADEERQRMEAENTKRKGKLGLKLR